MAWMFVELNGHKVSSQQLEFKSFFEARKHAQKLLRSGAEEVRFGNEDSDGYHQLTKQDR